MGKPEAQEGGSLIPSPQSEQEVRLRSEIAKLREKTEVLHVETAQLPQQAAMEVAVRSRQEKKELVDCVRGQLDEARARGQALDQQVRAVCQEINRLTDEVDEADAAYEQAEDLCQRAASAAEAAAHAPKRHLRVSLARLEKLMGRLERIQKTS